MVREKIAGVVADLEGAEKRLRNGDDKVGKGVVGVEKLKSHVTGKPFGKMGSFSGSKGLDKGPGRSLSFKGDEGIGGGREGGEKSKTSRAE